MIQGLLDSAGIPSVVDETSPSAEGEEMDGREPRNYGLIGGYVRIWAWSLGAMALAFLVFLLLRMT